MTLLAAAALVLCTVGPVSAAPALWVVKSATGKIYLFGTVHLLRDGTQWRAPEIDAAIKESQDLYLEIADPTNIAGAMSALVKVGFDRDHPLSTKISKADAELLDAAAKRYGFGGELAFESMRPWLVYMILSTAPELHSGYATSNGVDLQIRKDFAAAGKPIYGLETVDMQAHIFADLPETVQIALLDAQLKKISDQTEVTGLDSIVNAWAAGNQDKLAASMQLDKLAKSPLYAKIFSDRNKAWADALAKRLSQPGTSFISVGAGHLVGPGGVPALLAGMGFTVTRVEIAATPAAIAQATSSPATPVTSPTPSPTPIPQTLTPPAGWTARSASLAAGAFKSDRMWVEPHRRGVVLAGHIDLPGISVSDLDSLDALLHQGLVAVAKSALPSRHVKICNGKQDATYSKVTVSSVKEDIVLAVSDRGYIAEYVRAETITDDPAALRSILSLCAP